MIPHVPDHVLIHRIGKGAYGEVWLARNVLGTYRAVKIVRRAAFAEHRPYLREFEGVQRFEPISRSHPGFVGILHVGRNAIEDCFYYVMEIADDTVHQQNIQGGSYRPRSLSGDIDRHGKLPVLECIHLGIALSDGLGHLHRHGLVHRDIKPSNIIYIHGTPRLADIGLVATAGEELSGVGTPGFIPKEGPGSPRADIFALGRVLYRAATGNRVSEFPCLPTCVVEDPDWPRFARLNSIILKACAEEASDRYQTCDELQNDLLALQGGGRAALNRQSPTESLRPFLDSLAAVSWNEPADDERLVEEPVRALEAGQCDPMAKPPLKIEPAGGALVLDSKYYVVRPSDDAFRQAVIRWDSIVLVKGARQMGKTSLLARGLEQARQAGARVANTDFQKLGLQDLRSAESFFLALGGFLSDQLALQVRPEANWEKNRSPNMNFDRFLRREILEKFPGHLVWGLDEVDRLFTCDFGSEVFGLFRSWHNERALDPSGPWSRFTLAIAYATEAHLFITDVNQSPFNVGTRVDLEDFTLEQVVDLNNRYGSPLRSESELERFHSFLGGQPYLVQRAFDELRQKRLSFDALAAEADHDEGIFGDHLRRILVMLAKDAELMEVVRGILRGQPCPNLASFYRLRSGGVMRGHTMANMQPRCEIYATYLKRQLL